MKLARTRIKVCGIMDEEALFAACDAGADAVGFVFNPKSRRFIDPEEAFDLISFLPPFVSSVGVYIDASVERFSDIEEVCPTDRSQLHGSETEETVRRCGPGVIKTVRFDDVAGALEAELTRWSRIDEVDAVLVEAGTGAGGAPFDWSVVAGVREACRKPLIISGGLTAENVGAAIRAVGPYGVDVSEGVESAPGAKDRALIEAFCAAVRRADAG